MKDTLLGKYVSALDQKERKEFALYLKGYFKGEKTIPVRLFYILEKYQALEWQPEQIWEKLIKTTPFNKKLFNGYLSDLLLRLKEFLRNQRLNQNPDIKAILELQSVNRTELSDEFDKVWKAKILPLEKTKVASPEQIHFLFEAWKEKHNHSMRQKNPKYRSHVREINQKFDHYWILQKIIFACINHSTNSNFPAEKQIQTRFIEELIAIWDKSDIRKEIPLYGIYRDLYEIQTSDSLLNLDEAISNLEKLAPKLPAADSTLLFSLFFNTITTLHNKTTDTQRSFQAFMKLYAIGIKHKFLFSQGYLHETHYYSIILGCLKEKKYEEAHHYLTTWKTLLLPDLREDMFSLMKVIYHFFIGDYPLVLKLGRQVKIMHPFYEVQLRIYVIKATYECNYTPEDISEWMKDRKVLIQNCKSLAGFIRTHENLPELHKELFQNTVKVILKLLQAKTARALKTLQSYIENGAKMDEKLWILEKIRMRLEREFGELQGIQ